MSILILAQLFFSDINMKTRTVRLWMEILKTLDTVIFEVKYFFGRYWTGLTLLHGFAICYKVVELKVRPGIC